MSDMKHTAAPAGGEQKVATEDGDSAPSIEVAASDKGRPTCCLLSDEAAGLLWTADKEGWVYGERATLGWRAPAS